MTKPYVPIKINSIITAVGFEIQEGYYESIVETVYPSDEELDKFTKKDNKAWVTANNKRMTAICKLLNEQKL